MPISMLCSHIAVKIADAKTRKIFMEKQKLLAESEKLQPLSSAQIARLQWQIAQILEDGETVAAALRRLGGGSSRRDNAVRRSKKAKGMKGQRLQEDLQAAENTGHKDLFDILTAAATSLIESGDVDVYSRDKDYFKTAASVFIDIDENDSFGQLNTDTRDSLAPNVVLGPGKTAYEEANEDMFADDDEEEHPGKSSSQTARRAEEAELDVTDFASWPVKELRRFCMEKGQNVDGVVEKGDLIEKAKAAAKSGPTVASRNTYSPLISSAPAGFEWDAKSGMFYSKASGMYWHPNSGAFYNSNDGKWYAWSSDSGWIPWS